MFLRGAEPGASSQAEGHATVTFTADVQSHIIEGMQSDVMMLPPKRQFMTSWQVMTDS